MYEDHAEDSNHKVTSHILSQLGMSIFYIDEGGDIIEITQVEMLGNIKVNPTTGYNFFACKVDSCFMPAFVQP